MSINSCIIEFGENWGKAAHFLIAIKIDKESKYGETFKLIPRN